MDKRFHDLAHRIFSPGHLYLRISKPQMDTLDQMIRDMDNDIQRKGREYKQFVGDIVYGKVCEFALEMVDGILRTEPEGGRIVAGDASSYAVDLLDKLTGLRIQVKSFSSHDYWSFSESVGKSIHYEIGQGVYDVIIACGQKPLYREGYKPKQSWATPFWKVTPKILIPVEHFSEFDVPSITNPGYRIYAHHRGALEQGKCLINEYIEGGIRKNAKATTC